jgi:cell wall-associated NlpC family hydrolase
MNYPRVRGVVTQQGRDISDLCNRLADEHAFPPRVMVAGGIAESDLSETAERWGTWPDVSFGPWQQTVAYAPIGDQSASPANIAYVQAFLSDVAQAAEIAAPQYARFWHQYQDGPETLGRYNWPARGLQGNPNRANIERAWAASAKYLAEDPSMPNDLAERWITAMQALTGTPYVFGGKDPARDGGLDCSGLLTFTARQVGLDLGDPDYTSADALKGYCEPVDDDADVRRGDVLLFHSTYGNGGPNYATHCGVWLRPGWMIDTHDSVHETRHAEPYWQAHWLRVWRPRGLAEAPTEEEDPAMIAELQARVAELETITGEMRRVASEILIPSLEDTLAVKRLPAVAREKIALAAIPAANTISRLGQPEDTEEPA